MYFIRTTDNNHLLCSFFNLVLNRILIFYIKGSNHFRKEGRNQPIRQQKQAKMVPWSTVRAQYAKHNPPSHAKPQGGPDEQAMKAVGLQIEQPYEHSRFYPSPVTETTVHKKGSDTLLRNATFYFEAQGGIYELFIYSSPFFFHLWL